jgi:hypothetical protein
MGLDTIGCRPAFQSEKTGSTPVGSAKDINGLAGFHWRSQARASSGLAPDARRSGRRPIRLRDRFSAIGKASEGSRAPGRFGLQRGRLKKECPLPSGSIRSGAF